uniref:Uncharacterized protein n=1 Tax=Romanomermis culicivorax TaxID=13658 RepID=A0A915KER1_ROMCU
MPNDKDEFDVYNEDAEKPPISVNANLGSWTDMPFIVVFGNESKNENDYKTTSKLCNELDLIPFAIQFYASLRA